MSVLLEASGPTPPEEVWERYSSPARWPEWAPQIRRAALTSPLQTGEHGTVHGPWPTWVPVWIRSVDPERRHWSWRVGLGLLGLVMDHGVEATDDGSRAWVRIHAPGVLVAPYAPLAKLALRRLVS